MAGRACPCLVTVNKEKFYCRISLVLQIFMQPAVSRGRAVNWGKLQALSHGGNVGVILTFPASLPPPPLGSTGQTV